MNHLSDIVPQLADLEAYGILTEDILHNVENTLAYIENISADLIKMKEEF